MRHARIGTPPGATDGLGRLDRERTRRDLVVVLAPETIGELNQLMSRVGTWIAAQDFLAIRFHLEGRAHIMQRGGFVAPADRGRASDI